jgi:hypothetical protein
LTACGFHETVHHGQIGDDCRESPFMDDAVIGIATAIASGAGGSIGASGAAALGRLISALRAKFRGDPAARGTLEIAVESPGSQAAGDDLVAVLRARIANDPGFGEWLLGLWIEVAP